MPYECEALLPDCSAGGWGNWIWTGMEFSIPYTFVPIKITINSFYNQSKKIGTAENENIECIVRKFIIDNWEHNLNKQ